MKRFLICLTIIFALAMPCAVSAAVADTGLLWLINQDNRLDEAYEYADMIPYGKYTLRAETVEALELMLSDMQAQGVKGLYVQSAYRTYAYQQQIFNNKKTILLGLGYDEETAIEMTSQSIAFPGASEHQTGLAIDVTLDGRLNQAFAQTEAGRWIDAHCHEYGFVVRYAAEKTDITRIIYEPWHLRYVGMPHSAFMKEKNLCYEEYIDYLKESRLNVYWDKDGVYYLVLYTTEPAEADGLRNVVSISSDRPGDDAGYIITMRKVYPGLFPKN